MLATQSFLGASDKFFKIKKVEKQDSCELYGQSMSQGLSLERVAKEGRF